MGGGGVMLPGSESQSFPALSESKEPKETFMRRAPASGIPDNFMLTESTEAFCALEFPNVDIDKTLKIFRDKAEANGWLYSNWQAAFRNYLRNSEKYGGAVYKNGRAEDPRWTPVLSEVAPYGFRPPHPMETPAAYRTEFENWKKRQQTSKVTGAIDIRSALKALR
jgi:hypothetical protein